MTRNEYYINGNTFTREELLAWCWNTSENADEWEYDHCMFILSWFNESEYIHVKTSGSTGEPKEIKLLKSYMIASAKLSSEFFKLDEGTSALLCLPSKYIAGKMLIVRSLVNHWKLSWVEPSLNPISGLQENFDTVSFTPQQLHTIMEDDITLLDHFQVILAGGAALPSIVERRLKLCSANVYLTYGMTETISHVAVRNVRSGDSVFRALPGVLFSVNHAGCLVIDAKHLNHEIIETTDIVDLIDEHQFVLLGRKDDVINSGGIKLFPADIERKISILFHEKYFIWKKSNDVFGEVVVLYIEGERWGASRFSAMNAYLERNLEKFEIPKEIIFIEKFEMTETDKIIRKNYL